MDAQSWAEVGQLALAAAGGAGVVLAALLTKLGDFWTRRFQSSLDRVNTEKSARLGADLQRTALVDKVRFEHEYQIYQRLWADSTAYQAVSVDLALSMQEGNLAVVASVHKRYSDAYERLSKSMNENRPFLPENIFLSFSGTQHAMHSKLVPARDVLMAGNPVVDCFKSILPVEALSIGTSDLIRERLAEVRVV